MTRTFSPKNELIAVYPHRDATHPLCWLTLLEILDVIRQGGGVHGVPCYKATIRQIRQLFAASGECVEVKRLKTTLPAFTASCNFMNARRNKAQGVYTNLVVIDWDGKDNLARFAAGANAFRDELAGLPATVGAMLSPKGDGVKQLLLLDSVATRELHPVAVEALRQGLGQRMRAVADPNCTDLARSCYFTWDPDVYVEGQGNWGGEHPLCAVDTAEVMQRFPRPITPAQAAVGCQQLQHITATHQHALFERYIHALQESGISWKPGNRDAMIWALYKLGGRGAQLEMLLEQLTEHAATCGHSLRPCDRNKLTRLWVEYGSKWFGNATRPAVATAHQLQVAPGEYLSKHLDALLQKLRAGGVLYIDAPTGIGKTTLVAELAAALGAQADLLMPTRALVEQQSCAHVVGGRALTPDESAAPLLAAPYESAAKLRRSRPAAELLVIDEAHEMSTAYGYRTQTIQEIAELARNYRYVIYLSGSMFPVLPDTGTLPEGYVKVQRTDATQRPFRLVKPQRREPARDYFLRTLQPNTLNVFYCNNKAELGTLAELLKSQELRVAVIHAQQNSTGAYEDVMQYETLSNYDVLLCTSLIQSGVNITDADRPVRIVFAPGCQLVDYIQFPARWRRVVAEVEILHAGELGPVQAYDPLGKHSAWQQAQAELHTRLAYESQEETSERMLHGLGEARFVDAPNGIYRQPDGTYAPCEQYTRWKQYEQLCRNAQRNVSRLREVLVAHDFVEQAHPAAAAEALSSELQQQSRALRQQQAQAKKQQLQDFARALLCNEGMPQQAVNREQVQVHDRLQRLVRLGSDCVPTDVASLNDTVETLCSAEKFGVRWNRQLYLQLLSHEKAGHPLVVAPETQLMYQRLRDFSSRLTPGLHITRELMVKLQEAGLPTSDNEAVKKVLSIVAESQSCRWRDPAQAGQRVCGYRINAIRQPTQAPDTIVTDEFATFMRA